MVTHDVIWYDDARRRRLASEPSPLLRDSALVLWRFGTLSILQLSIDCLQSAGRFEPAAYASSTTQKRKRREAALGAPKQGGRAMHRQAIQSQVGLRFKAVV